MRILLFGEYSRFHNSLKEGLIALGHDVLLVGNNDFKGYPLDISFYASFFKNSYLLNKFRHLVYRLTAVDLAQYETAIRFFLNRKQCVGFDAVQLVNEYPVGTTARLEKMILNYIFTNNSNVFVSACGDDFVSVRYMTEGKFTYSTMTPCLQNPSLGHCKFSYLYLTAPFKRLHEFVYQNVKAVIPGDLDYAIPWKGMPKATQLIPYPINTTSLQQLPLKPFPIRIFHGINEANYYKKGNAFFEEALSIIRQRYPDAVEINEVRSVPYNTYISLYNDCHILLDQVYSYDQGYNALEAMAKGKVVFTGAEQEFVDHFNLDAPVAINAVPDTDKIVNQLAYLIEHPEKINEISRNARQFVEQHHNYKRVAQQYIDIWTSDNNPDKP